MRLFTKEELPVYNQGESGRVNLYGMGEQYTEKRVY
jgi:hypothetical protein